MAVASRIGAFGVLGMRVLSIIQKGSIQCHTWPSSTGTPFATDCGGRAPSEWADRGRAQRRLNDGRVSKFLDDSYGCRSYSPVFRKRTVTWAQGRYYRGGRISGGNGVN